MKIFCPHCGTPHSYVGVKPNFCSSCGESLNSFKKKQQVQNTNVDYLEDEEETDEFTEPNMPRNPLAVLKSTASLNKFAVNSEYGRKTFSGKDLVKSSQEI